MTRRSPADIAIATRLLLAEGGAESAAAASIAAVRIYAKLAERLTPLIGGAGVRALFARSARLTMVEYPCLAALSGAADAGSLSVEERIGTCFGALDAVNVAEAAIALYGTLIALLSSFIGEALVGQVLRSAFPALEHDIQKEMKS